MSSQGAKQWHSKIDSGFEKIVALASNKMDKDQEVQKTMPSTAPPPLTYYPPAHTEQPAKKPPRIADSSLAVSKHTFPKWRALLNWNEEAEEG